MTKTIEEAAWNFARKQWGKQIPHSVNKIADMLIDFGNEVMAMPLSERMTDEEMERINNAYAYAITHIEFDEHRAEVRLLHRIFGKEFFKFGK